MDFQAAHAFSASRLSLKVDSHADDIVKAVREEFDKGNDFCLMITYKTTRARPEDLRAAVEQLEEITWDLASKPEEAIIG